MVASAGAMATFAGIGDFADFDAYFDALFAFFADPANWTCDPDAPVLLAALRESGLGLGVISNFDYRIYAILEALGLSRYFDRSRFRPRPAARNPRPRFFGWRWSAIHTAADQALHVGDSERWMLRGRARRASPWC